MLYGHFCVLYMMLQFLYSEYSKKVIFEVVLIFQKKLGPLIISGFMVFKKDTVSCNFQENTVVKLEI